MGEEAAFPDYFEVIDQISKKPCIGRFVPDCHLRGEGLNWLTHVKHFGLLPIYLLSDVKSALASVSPCSPDLEMLYPERIRSLGAADVNLSVFNVIGGIEFLVRNGVFIRSFGVNHLVFDPERKTRIAYLEDVFPLAELEPEDVSSTLNWVYLPPETIEHKGFDAKSVLYYCGQVLIHLLTGNPHYRHKALQESFLEGHHLKKELKQLLWSMTEPNAQERWSWSKVLREAARVSNQSKKNLPDVRLFHNNSNAIPFPKNGEGRFACALQTGPGREGVHLRNQILNWSQQNGFLFLHLWQESQSKSPFESINQMVDLIKGPFLERLGLSEEHNHLPKLTSWQSPSENLAYWKPVIFEIKRALLTNRFKGISLLFEDLHHMDPESIGVICTLFNWLEKDRMFFAACAPHFLDKNLKTLCKYSPVPIQIIKPKVVSLDVLREMTDSFQMGRKRCEYTSMHRRFQGNQSLLTHELNATGEAVRFLERMWRNLKPEWQRFFTLLACSFQSLSESQVSRLMDQSHIPDPRLLKMTGFLDFHPTRGFAMTNPAIRSFCQHQIDDGTRQFLWEKLLDDPECRAIQKLIILANQKKMEQAEGVLSQAVDDFLINPELFLEAGFPSEDLPIYASEETEESWKSLPKVLQIFCAQFYLARNHLPSKEVTRLLPEFQNYIKGMEAERNLDYQKAFSCFKLATKRPTLPFYFRMKAVVKALNVASEAPGFSGLTKLARIFLDAPWPTEFQNLRMFFTSQIQAMDHKLSAFDAEGTGRFGEWPLACKAWFEFDFTKCLFHLERYLEYLPPWLDDRERGLVYKLYGNALYRNNHPELAAKEYRKARVFFERSGQEVLVAAVMFNLASTEKLAGNLLEAQGHFHELKCFYEQMEDPQSEIEVLFNLMEITLLRGQFDMFEELFVRHQSLCKKHRNILESVRGLIVGQYHSLGRSKSMVRENRFQLQTLLEKHEFDPLIRNEAELANRIAAIRLNLPMEAVPPRGAFTGWRHLFLDYLAGESSLSLSLILKQEEKGYFEGLKYQLVTDAMLAGYLPGRSLPGAFLMELKRYCIENEAAFHQLLMAEEDIMPAGIGRNMMKRLLQLFAETIQGENPQQTFHRILEQIRNSWSFNAWGVTGVKKLDCMSEAAPLPLFLETMLKSELKTSGDQVPFFRSWFDEQGRSHDYLFIPTHEAVFWFARPAGETIGKPALDWMMFQALLDRSYDSLKPSISSRKRSGDSSWLQNQNNYPDVIEDRFWGDSPSIRELKQQVAVFGNSDMGIHIAGESGTGKELVARLLHDVSSRKQRGFRAINCCDFSENLIESELFGHVRGAFTGADRDRIGVIEQLHGGTLFLDEIGDLAPKVQSLLLRFLQEKEFSRAGENKVRHVDVRVITATNKSLQRLMDEGTFRPDLFFRIAETELYIPPLRQRLEDLTILTRHLLARFSPGRRIQLAPSFLSHLRTHSWPGNVRELENYLKKVLVLHPSVETLAQEHMPDFLRSTLREDRSLLTLEGFERRNRRQFIVERLDMFQGNRTRTAESLGVSRQQLIRLIKKLEIDTT